MKTSENYQQRLENLITIMKRSGFLNNDKVELAIRKMLRHEFVPFLHKEKE